MDSPTSHEITELLLAWGNGDRSALERLIPLIYAELRRIAERELNREDRPHTLQPTALVNEAFLKLIKQDRAQWQNRQQFFGVAAETMQNILIDYARKHFAGKRGGRAQKITLDEMLGSPDHPVLEMSDAKMAELLTLADGLRKLRRRDPEKSRVFALRYTLGFSLEETCEALGLSLSTVTRHQRIALAFLKLELTRTQSGTASDHSPTSAQDPVSAREDITDDGDESLGGD